MFSCEFCSKELSTKQSLERHLKTCKTRGLEKEKYSCDNCGKEFTTKWYCDDHLYLCKMTKKSKLKKESDKKLAFMRDKIKELEIENKLLKELKQQKVSYVQNVINMHGLEPLDLSQERFDKIVEDNYTFKTYIDTRFGKHVLKQLYSNDEGKPNVFLSDHNRMTMRYIDLNNKVCYHKPFDLLCLIRNSKILEEMTKKYEQEYLKPYQTKYCEDDYTLIDMKRNATLRSSYYKNEKSLLTQIKFCHIALGCDVDYKRLIIDPLGFDPTLSHNALKN